MNITPDMFTLFEKTPDLVCIVTKEGFFQQINQAVVTKLEYSKEELLSHPVSFFIHPEDKERTALIREKLLNCEPLLNFQNRYLTKSGKAVWLEWTSVYLPDNKLVFAISKDISIHKEKEKEMFEKYTRSKHLVSHFKKNVEKDRELIAMGLHEDLAQLATVVKMETEWIDSQLKDIPLHLSGRLHQLTKTTNLLLNNIRKIAYSFGDGNISDLGFDAALEDLAYEFSQITGIECNYSSEFTEEVISYEIRLDLYRICQEALLNIMQHAEASLVNISIKQENESLLLTISDNGKGFDQETTKYAAGLTGMYGRALTINGQLVLASDQNGTVLEVAIAPASSS